jgi:phosphomethylpyrimidine synthase
MITSPNAAKWTLPHHGATDPATTPTGTTPGSFANRADIGGPLSYSSPDTPGMPQPSDKTAWDFLPEGWSIEAAPDHAKATSRPSRSATRSPPAAWSSPRTSTT